MDTRINQPEINMGVDSGKYQLNIYIRPLGIFLSVSNDEKVITVIKNQMPLAGVR